MGAFELRSANRRAQPLATDRIIAVVADASSEEVIKNLMLDQGIGHAYVARGGIDDAIELMRGLPHSPRHLLVDVSGASMPVSELMRLAMSRRDLNRAAFWVIVNPLLAPILKPASGF